MITAGCDIGSLTAKAVIMNDDAVLAWEVMRAFATPEKSAREGMERALAKAGLKFDDIESCVGTGYGRKHISFVNRLESEIACHARGAFFMLPAVRTVVDIGGQDAKAIKIDEGGNVARYVYNDKCASGTGRFLEIIADALEVPPKKVENMIQVARRPLSLETPTDDEEDSVLGDFIEDDEAAPPDDTATYNLLREHLGEVLNGLPPREVRILQLRYGLLDGQAYTLEEVGRKMGVTRERVRQIEAQALSRLRHPSVRRKLRDYLGE